LPPLSDSNCYDNISQSVTAVSKILNENDDIIIFEDFNLPKIYWPCNIRNNTDEIFLDSLHLNNLYQISDVKNTRKIQLDLIFSSTHDNISVHEASFHEKNLNNSIHHSAIVLICNFDLPQKTIFNNNRFYAYFFFLTKKITPKRLRKIDYWATSCELLRTFLTWIGSNDRKEAYNRKFGSIFLRFHLLTIRSFLTKI
jgi:hypothetical protein